MVSIHRRNLKFNEEAPYILLYILFNRGKKMSLRGLSKSKIISGLQCQKRLYLDVHQPDLKDDSGSSAMSSGTHLGEVARGLWSGGVLIEYGDKIKQALEDTKSHLEKDGDVTLFEATFSFDNILCRADVLTRKNGKYQLIEVKGSTSLKSYHIDDCAVQLWVIEKTGYQIEKVELAHVDKSFIYPGGGDYIGILHHEDITEQVRSLKNQVAIWIEESRQTLAGNTPNIEAGEHCFEPYGCAYYSYCTSHLSKDPEYPVQCLPNGGAIVKELLEEGILDIRDIPEGRLTKQKHERVRRVTVNNCAEVDPELKIIINKLGYPRYYLDFETFTFLAVPIWAGTRPYQSHIPFQWSCHIEGEDGSLQHEEFLEISRHDIRRKLTEKLIDTVGTDGPIIVYGAFENTVINKLAELFPDLASELEAIRNRLVDLIPILRKHYYHPDMKGSWSIKKVLPAIDPDLAYSSLGEVQEGVGAGASFFEAIDPDTTEERREKLVKDLKAYCALDTLGIYKVLDYFRV